MFNAKTAIGAKSFGTRTDAEPEGTGRGFSLRDADSNAWKWG